MSSSKLSRISGIPHAVLIRWFVRGRVVNGVRVRLEKVGGKFTEESLRRFVKR